MLTGPECERVAEFLQGFTNPVRIKILCVLRQGEKNVSEIAELIGEKQSNVSQQLKILAIKGYVVRHRRERNIYYSLRNEDICRLMEMIQQVVFKEQVHELRYKEVEDEEEDDLEASES